MTDKLPAAEDVLIMLAQLERGLRLTDRLLLRVPEAAELLGMSEDSLERLIRAGDIPTVQPRRGTRKIARADLEAYVDHLRGVPVASDIASNESGALRILDQGMRRSMAQRARNAAKRRSGAAL